MSKKLVVVESPAKCKTIKKFLGADYLVEASMGHILDLPTKSLGVDIKKNFNPHYVVIRGKSKIIDKLKAAALKSDSIFLATDPDREGEAIAWHLAQHIAQGKKVVQRITFNEITRHAVEESIQHPHALDMNKVNAQQARRVLDRLVGYQVSPILWKTIHGRLSAGRVQSVALRLVCEREVEVQQFVPQEYWDIAVKLLTGQQQGLEAQLVRISGVKAVIENQDQAQKLKATIEQKKAFTVAAIEKKNTSRNPKPPFITSTLQQDANRKINFSAKKTMLVAQQLYEGVEIGTEGPVGMITYMRTDSTRIADEAVEAARMFIASSYGKEYVPDKPRVYRSKKSAQDAHEAIRPTSVLRTPAEVKSYLSKEQFQLYDLIWKRFLASQMENAVYEQTRVDITADELQFQANGSDQKFKGYLLLYDEQEENDPNQASSLPPLANNAQLSLQEVLPKQHFTQPPARYTEASLIKELELKGIGRPSTYAQIISTNIERKYITMEDKKFSPTELGKVTNTMLVGQFPDIFNVDFTADMEERLDRIEEGQVEWTSVLKDFYTPFEKRLAEVNQNKNELKKNLQDKTGEVCEKCGKEMIIKWGRNGRFVACSGYPACKNAKPLKEPGQPEEEKTNQKCPVCGAEMVVKRGRFGRFLACSAYPACKTTQPLTIGVACPQAGCDGMISERHTKKGKIFYSCNRYPKCGFMSWNRPVNQTCTQCNANYLVEKWSKKTGKYLACLTCKATVQLEKQENA